MMVEIPTAYLVCAVLVTGALAFGSLVTCLFDVMEDMRL